jgi:type II secretory pathway pseudopilin PulG
VSLVRRLSRRLDPRREEGWLIIEIMIGAVVLIIAGLAIYQGLDRASSASGRNRNRSVASFLAQQDQERLRSLDTTVLTGYIGSPNVRTVSVGGNNYTVTSTVQWANDTNGVSTSCASASNIATYLKISSTVTDPTGKNGPTTLDSLLSPRSDQGGAAAQIVDRTGTTGVPGIPVNLDEAPALSDTTDSNGCAQFGFLRGTDWHVSFQANGYVDKDGNNSITSKPLTVVTAASSVTQFQYDRGGAITASFRDLSSSNNTASGRGLTVFQSNMSGNQERSFLTGTGLTDNGSAISANNGTYTTPMTLFPFTSTYSVWAGSCDAAKPPTANQRTVTVSPATTFTMPASTAYLEQPKLTVTVKDRTSSGGTYTNYQSADVYVKDVCGAVYPKLTTNASGQASSGYPFGTVTVCVDDNKTTQRYQAGTVTIGSGTNSLTLNLDSYSGGDPTGACSATGPWS